MHVFFSVGEPSGDQHAALLIRELRRKSPPVRVSGFGGPRMEQSGCHLLFPLTTLAVMGIFAVIPSLWKFYRLYRLARNYLKQHRPDLVVLVDFPGFNWWIAKAAKAHGIPVVYYLPPQLWAWAPWRIRKVRKSVDLVLSGLPFEAEWYAQRGVPALFVGHPFFDEVAEHPLDEPFLREWTSTEQLTVAVLPGSRRHEVEGNWPLMLEAVRRVHELHPRVQFLVANYLDKHRAWCQSILQPGDQSLPLSFFVGKTPEIIELADCGLMVSGSVSLEMLARGTPATVLYRVNRLTYLIGRMLVTIKYMSLPNLIAGRMVMPEHLSVGDPETAIQAVTADLHQWLGDAEALAAASLDLRRLRQKLFATGATERVAQLLLDRLPQPAETPASRAA